MGKSLFVEVPDPSEQLFKDVAGGFFLEHFGLGSQSEELSVLGYFHDIVHDSVNFTVNSAVYSPHIEVNNLNYVSMFCLQTDPHLVQKHLQSFLLVPSLHVVLLYFMVHYLNGHSLVIRQL